MAPPPSASLPLSQRLMALAQTLQFAWFAGHLTLLFCIFRYSLSYISFNYYSGWAQFSYRTAFISAAVTYGIVVYKAFRARARAGNKAPGGIFTIIGDENVQYLAMALVWLFSPQYPLAMLPFGVYSIFHVATYTRTNLIPTIQPPQPVSPGATSPSGKPAYKPNPTADTIGRFVKEYYDASMGLVAGLEIALWIRILLSVILFRKGSWILIVLYTAFLRARFAQSTFVQVQFKNFEARVDAIVGAQSPAVRQIWDNIKNAARSFHDLTNISKYAGGAAAPKKTS
ncbi:hypothetical protein F5884DRAFT_422584 [Xylogone sp. PMI_703]|nr:hypothetical protein F5884DRAFT_422584 [Xylogone sp. PMI_703]